MVEIRKATVEDDSFTKKLRSSRQSNNEAEESSAVYKKPRRLSKLLHPLVNIYNPGIFEPYYPFCSAAIRSSRGG